jgi:hypothetical protein
LGFLLLNGDTNLTRVIHLLLLPKKLNIWSTTKSDCSSGIQCPESGTMTPCTFVARACIEFNLLLPGRSPSKAGYILNNLQRTRLLSPYEVYKYKMMLVISDYLSTCVPGVQFLNSAYALSPLFFLIL